MTADGRPAPDQVEPLFVDPEEWYQERYGVSGADISDLAEELSEDPAVWQDDLATIIDETRGPDQSWSIPVPDMGARRGRSAYKCTDREWYRFPDQDTVTDSVTETVQPDPLHMWTEEILGGILLGFIGGITLGMAAAVYHPGGLEDDLLLSAAGADGGAIGGGVAGTISYPARSLAAPAIGFAAGATTAQANQSIEAAEDTVDLLYDVTADLLYPRHGDEIGHDAAETILADSKDDITLAYTADDPETETGFAYIEDISADVAADYQDWIAAADELATPQIVLPDTEPEYGPRGTHPFPEQGTVTDAVTGTEYEIRLSEEADDGTTFYLRGTYTGDKDLTEAAYESVADLSTM